MDSYDEHKVGVDLGQYYGWRYSLVEVLDKIQENGAEYTVLLKVSFYS
ncbi:MAG: hypothetical protein NC307_06625 [Roseburia sp.]|nr:hypothetical protein [Roseburia sp.]